jgi:hypothetical protein
MSLAGFLKAQRLGSKRECPNEDGLKIGEMEAATLLKDQIQ